MARSAFTVGCVITTCAGREENLLRTLACLRGADPAPDSLVVVFDGCDEPLGLGGYRDLVGDAMRVFVEKHEPGLEQPRNVGARVLQDGDPPEFAWFLDSDMIFEPDILARFKDAHEAADADRILIGPYEFMGWGMTTIPDPSFRTDIRWASFDEHPPDHVLVHDLGAGLGCFGGNLVWPLGEFARVGGFHPELHHGRCEDGELGLRAASAGVPMSLAGGARAWHVAHPVDATQQGARNARDVPLLNSWHPWVESDYYVTNRETGERVNMRGRLVTQEDGARFWFACPDCGERVDSLDYWDHYGRHWWTAHY